MHSTMLSEQQAWARLAHHIDVALVLGGQHLERQVVPKGTLPWAAHLYRIQALLCVLRGRDEGQQGLRSRHKGTSCNVHGKLPPSRLQVLGGTPAKLSRFSGSVLPCQQQRWGEYACSTLSDTMACSSSRLPRRAM